MHRDHQDQGLFIGGTWSPPSTDQVIEVISPHTESVVASVPAAGPADVDAAVTAARSAFDEGPWPRLEAPSERIDAMRRLTKLYSERQVRDGPGDQHRARRAHHVRPARTGRSTADDDGRLLRRRGRLSVAGDSARLLRLRPPHPARADRRGRRDRAVEHAAVSDRHQAGARPARRVLRRAQTGARIPARRAARSPTCSRRSGCRRAWSACYPATENSARISSPTLAWTRCRSPARRRRDGAWHRRVAPSSSGSASNSAASPLRSSSPTPIPPPSRPESGPRACPTAARSAMP